MKQSVTFKPGAAKVAQATSNHTACKTKNWTFCPSLFETLSAILYSMASTIETRRATQEGIQQIQQEKADKKRALAEQSREHMKAIKAKYHEMSKEIDQDTSAAINHIKAEAQEDNDEIRAERAEAKAAIYNRRGQQQNNHNGVRQASHQGQSILTEKPATQVMESQNDSREDDDFYKVQDRGSQISEKGDGYVIKAFAPEYEKDNLRLSVANNRAVLSGKRKFQDSVDDGQKKISTNNFQTFHEEFKFDRPVASEGMTRERDGDYVEFFIPKLESLKFEDEG